MYARFNSQNSSLISKRFFSHSADKVSSLFNSYPVIITRKDVFTPLAFLPSLRIFLSNNISPKNLPYAEVYTPEILQGDGLQRINRYMVVARGDSRSPNELLAAGGFHPQATNPYSSQKFGEDILNVASHRESAWGSGLVAFSSSLTVALNIPESRYVYLAKAAGVIGPHAKHYAEEKECSQPGGLDFEDVIAFRVKLTSKSFEHSPIFVSKSFETSHPTKIKSVIGSYLRSDECCKINDTLISQNDAISSPEMKVSQHPHTLFGKINKSAEQSHEADIELASRRSIC